MHALAAGLASGLAVGFAEESLFRGLIQGSVIRELRRPLVGVVIVAVLFAAMHFLADTRIENDAVTPESGLLLLSTIADNWLSPASIFDGFCALLVVGLLTGLVTWWTGAIALSVGLHAGWVWMMRVALTTTRIDEHASTAWLIYRPHGYVGWLTFAWTLVMLGLLVTNRRHFLRWRDPGAFRR
jgi:membrane protease YdiL (CAAX protease family)